MIYFKLDKTKRASKLKLRITQDEPNKSFIS